MMSTTRNHKRLLPEGELVGDTYQIGDLIGIGGMGQVFEAWDRTLERRVALKISRPDVDGAYLDREGKLLARFNHPGIVTVHHRGRHEGCEYVVLERLFGLTLSQHLEQRGPGQRFALEDAVEILIELSSAVGVLHRASVVHRDLKPSNAMLAPGRRVVLFDFGVALGREHGEFQPGRAGSPHYMAPEAIESIDGPPGPLADIYALGCIAFELLTGRVPFDGSAPEAVLLGHLREEPRRVSELNPDVSPPLDRLVYEMMRKTAEQRPQSADVVGAWLRGIRRGQLGLGASDPVSVLIADDEEDFRALLASFVERGAPGSVVATAGDGIEALDEIRADPPDVLLLDLDMPHMSGVELCMHLAGSAHTRHTTICAISAAATPTDRELLTRLGVSRFIDKLDNPGTILAEVTNLVAQTARTRARVVGSGPGSGRL
jgi:serine/threonine-protein kinase